MPSRRLFVALITLCLAGALAPLPAQAPQVLPGLEEMLKPVRDRFAPDRRLAVFDITAEPTAGGLLVKGAVERAEAKEAALQAIRAAGHTELTDQVAVLPDAALGAATLGLVRVSVANVRTRPSHPAEMATQTVMGWSARVLKKQGGWYYVHTEPDQYLGWIEELQLTLVTADALRAWESAPRVIVTAPIAFVREAAGDEATPVSDVVMGSLLKRLSAEGAWIGVELPDTRRGFVRNAVVADYAEWRALRRPTADGFESTATLFMGVPYLWGGTSSKGFDCSGFAKTVLRMNGIELPRDTDQQAREGVGVPIDEALSQVRKGDLLFFGTKATADRPERVSHVGLAVGNGEFLHASGLVRRNSLLPASPIFSESLRERLLHVRRVLPQ
jgi:gamma-D-glutamyl-L-lysine dipeptidyl-peptidase